jgi:hypothetical protein
MSVTATTGAGAPYAGQKYAEPPTPRQGEYSARYSGEKTQGGDPPKDFGHRDPDYNHDGVISEAESRAYDADVRSEDRRYQADSRERMAHEREEGKNYRADMQAYTAQIQSNNDNKMHKLFGKQMAPPPPPPVRPQGPSAT